MGWDTRMVDGRVEITAHASNWKDAPQEHMHLVPLAQYMRDIGVGNHSNSWYRNRLIAAVPRYGSHVTIKVVAVFHETNSGDNTGGGVSAWDGETYIGTSKSPFYYPDLELRVEAHICLGTRGVHLPIQIHPVDPKALGLEASTWIRLGPDRQRWFGGLTREEMAVAKAHEADLQRRVDAMLNDGSADIIGERFLRYTPPPPPHAILAGDPLVAATYARLQVADWVGNPLWASEDVDWTEDASKVDIMPVPAPTPSFSEVHAATSGRDFSPPPETEIKGRGKAKRRRESSDW